MYCTNPALGTKLKNPRWTKHFSSPSFQLVDLSDYKHQLSISKENTSRGPIDELLRYSKIKRRQTLSYARVRQFLQFEKKYMYNVEDIDICDKKK